MGVDKLVGVDFSISQLKLAQKSGVARLVNSNFLDMPFEDKTFNGIWSCVTLVHSNKEIIGKILDKVRKILKSNGLFFISLQEGKGIKVVRQDIYGGVPMIMNYYMPKEIKELLIEKGFEVLDYERFHVWKGVKDKERIFFNFYCRKVK